MTVNTNGVVQAGGQIIVGRDAGPQASALSINTGAIVSGGLGIVGKNVGSQGVVNVSGSQWNTTGLLIGELGDGWVNANSGTSVVTNSMILGNSSTAKGTLSVNGGSVNGAATADIGRFGIGAMVVQAGGVVSGGSAALGSDVGGAGTATIKNANSLWSLSGTLDVGRVNEGTLSITNGGGVETIGAVNLGTTSTGIGAANISGTGSHLATAANMYVGGSSAGERGSGSVSISNGGTLAVGGNLTLWSTASLKLSNGTLKVGGFNNQDGTFDWSTGSVQFLNSVTLNDPLLTLLVGSGHELHANKFITCPGKAVTVEQDTSIHVMGGQLSSGPIENYGSLWVSSGNVTTTGSFVNNGFAGGLLVLDGSGQIQANTVQNDGTWQMAGVFAKTQGGLFTNNGTLLGTGTVAHPLNNNGTIQISATDRLVIANGGTPSNNSGGIQLGGGRIDFTGVLNNLPGGLISGRGILATKTASPGQVGLTNRGAVAFSGGPSDVFGDVSNLSGGQIITSGGAVTTFHDDVVHNGTEIRTSLGSRTVFLGSASGAGAYTGTGLVQYEGDLRPGNSPANVTYQGDVEFGPSSLLQVELGGPDFGSQYDRLTIEGLLSLAGGLEVDLINGFHPHYGDSFMIVDNHGSDLILGQFGGLSEGTKFFSGGQSYIISYAAGSGNDVSLTAVPEPSCVCWLALIAVTTPLCRSRRRRHLSKSPSDAT